MSEPLRPFTLGEILDRTAQLFRRNFLLFAGVAAVPIGVIVAAFAPMGAAFGLFGGTVVKGGTPSNVLVGVLVAALLLVGLPVGIAATALSQAALTRAAVGAHLGETLKIRTVLKSVWPRLGRYVWLLILQAIFIGAIPGAAMLAGVASLGALANLSGPGSAAGVGIGFLIFILFAAAAGVVVWLALRYALAFAVCVVEEKPAWNSLQRAAVLSKGTRGRIFVMFLLVWALSMVLMIAAYVPIAIVLGVVAAIGQGSRYAVITLVIAEIFNVLVNFAVQSLITPVYATALSLFYFDQRIRKEGYDIERMMEQAGLTAPETPPGQERAAITSGLVANIDTLKES